MTRVETISAGEIDGGLEAAWRGFVAADPDLRSGFFSPDFCRLVGAVRGDLRIAVLSDGGAPVGVLPFHRAGPGRLAPLAGEISDYHGIIGRAPDGLDMPGLLKALGAQVFDFNHVPASQAGFRAHAYLEAPSRLVDLSAGFETWRLERRAAMRNVREVERRARKLGREVGELSFVANDGSDAVWQALLDWKRAALRAIGVKLILDRPWAREVVERVRAEDGTGFGGRTSVLRAGGELAAVHFVMRAGPTLHGWFASYNPALERYSPGLALLMEALRHAEGDGITEVDFGRGDERYKREFANAERLVCEGSVERQTPLGLTRRLRKGAQALAGRSGSAKLAAFTRRAGNRLLRAGRLG